MTTTVFFSWQSDSPRKQNTDFIRTALENSLKGTADVQPVMRVDVSTAGLSGTPDIPYTIFEKLTATAVAVFDVTPVGVATTTKKALPNPNVLLELGFAAHAIGWERIILVMNTADDYKPEQLPFDLRHRRFPISYKAVNGNENEERELLQQKFKEYIGQALQAPHLAVERTKRRLTRDCPYFIEHFGKQPSFHWPHPFYQSELHRMIDLRLLEYDLDPAQNLYAYHWTYLGQELGRWYFERKLPGPIKSVENSVESSPPS